MHYSIFKIKYHVYLVIFLGLHCFADFAFASDSFNENDSLKPVAIIEDGLSAVDMYLLISKSFKSTNIDSASLYANRALELALEVDDFRRAAESLFTLGKIGLRGDSLSNARDNFYLALSYTNKCDCDSLKASIFMFLGKSYAFQDNYSEAISNFMKSLEIAEAKDNKLVLADLLDDIGLVMTFLTDYEQAMDYFKRALFINKELDDQQNYATTLRNIGFVQQGRSQFPEARKSFNLALEIYSRLNYFPGMSTANLGIGNTEFLMGEYESALVSYKMALSMAQKIEVNSKVLGPYILALCYNGLGKTYLKQGNIAEAKKALQTSIDLCDKFGIPGSKAKAAYFFSQLYGKSGNTSLSFEYFKIYHYLSDSIINARNVSMITKKEMEYQYLKKQKEKELEQLRKEEAYKRKVLMYEFLFGIAVVVLILLISVFILYRKNERIKLQQSELNHKNLLLEKENLQKELDFKNRELTTNVMYQLKKNNFIWKISEKLKEIALLLKPENQKRIREVVKELDSNMSKESWEEFEYRFNEVHSNFYDSLINDFPDLTPNELKLAAFLKLNMTTKDIGTITYQSVNSITIARYRLRTKIGLRRDENLISFFSKY